MPRESWSHENIVELQRQFLKKLHKILVVANIFLLLATHSYQSINKDTTDVFEGHHTVKWIYYVFEISYTISHLIDSMEWSSRSIFYHAKMTFGTLGFETLLWIIASYHAWFFMNLAIFNVALLCALGPEFLNIQPTNTRTLDGGPILEVSFDLPGN